MRIKFLSIIASFFMVSFVITSCLNDDNNVEYSPDATIHAFELDTIGGYGVNYKFTIDQMKGLIYNEDSLPVGADTIVDRILIKKLSTTSGIVAVKDKNGEDSLLNISDSIDLTKYINVKQDKQLKLTVYAPDMETKKTYYLELRMHLQDPDSLNWGNRKGEKPMPFQTSFSNGKITGKQKVVIFGEDSKENLIVYAVENKQLIAYRSSLSNGKVWNPVTINGIPEISSLDISSIIEFNGNLYMVANNSIYWSDNGSDWQLHATLNSNNLKFATLLTGIQPDESNPLIKNAGIPCIASEDGGLTYSFYMSDSNGNQFKKGESIESTFPKRNISSTLSYTRTGVPFIIAMGDNILREEESNPEPIVPWSTYDGLSWEDLSTNSSYCPMLIAPAVLTYNDAFYAFGNDFQTFYTSPSGLTWKEAGKKFYFPENLKSRKGSDYSVVVDKNQFIWIICSSNGNGGDDVWRARLNKLGFDRK